jgi:triosephosphate isomerase
MRKLIAGNWKMSCFGADAISLSEAIRDGVAASPKITDGAELLVCPPALYIGIVQTVLGQNAGVSVGGQDCAISENGAHTGDISAEMLIDAGCEYVILGHSERRQNHGEDDDLIAKKAARAFEEGLHVILCVGETERQRDAGQAQNIVAAQIENADFDDVDHEKITIAYEPVWAIGTGKTASADDVKDMHGFIRGKLQEKLASGSDIRILYGGSVKPDNAKALLSVPNVDGALIGGASLNAESFLAIAEAANEAERMAAE